MLLSKATSSALITGAHSRQGCSEFRIEELFFSMNLNGVDHVCLESRTCNPKVESSSLGPAGIVGGGSECTALSQPQCHDWGALEQGTEPPTAPRASQHKWLPTAVCVHGVCVCVCVCSLWMVYMQSMNSEYGSPYLAVCHVTFIYCCFFLSVGLSVDLLFNSVKGNYIYLSFSCSICSSIYRSVCLSVVLAIVLSII